MNKPDFIIVGAMKSATSTLHAQLALQKGIFMTHLKEPNYFSDNDQYKKGEEWYESLFLNAKEGDLCGESSTHYTKLPHYPLTLERMSKRLVSPKLIYVMRHPIDRLVSHYIHQWSCGVITCDINQAINKHDELVAYSCYAMQLEPYIKKYGRENVLCLFMESINSDPQAQLEKVADFIGYQGLVEWEFDLAQQNVSRERLRNFLGYKILIDNAVMVWIRRNCVPQVLRNCVKNYLSMQKRPVINSEQLEYLTAVFDDDLQQLSIILGCKAVSCDNYNKVVVELSRSI